MPSLPKKNNIGKRLSAAAEYAAAPLYEGEGKLFAIDVGTDHAKLPIHLAMRDDFCHITATDIAEGPCHSAVANISSCPEYIRDKISVVRTDGLTGLDDVRCNRVIIAGMGGELIRDILTKADFVRADKEKIKFVLQPQTKAEILRAYLCDGYRILDERFLIDGGKYYVVIAAIYDGVKRESTSLELNFGRVNLEKCENAFCDYFKRRYEILGKNIAAKKEAGMSGESVSDDEALYLQMKEYIEEKGI